MCNKILFFSALIPFVFIYPQTQLDTTEYFPLQNGDHWEYMSQDIGNNTVIFETVTGDTLMSNGKSYKILKITYSDVNYAYYIFYRNEGNLVYRYTGSYDTTKCQSREYIEYDFSAKDSVIWSICYDSFGG